MTIDYERLVEREFPVVRQRYDQRDVLIYALGIGLGFDPTDERQLPFVMAERLQVFHRRQNEGILLQGAPHNLCPRRWWVWGPKRHGASAAPGPGSSTRPCGRASNYAATGIALPVER